MAHSTHQILAFYKVQPLFKHLLPSKLDNPIPFRSFLLKECFPHIDLTVDEPTDQISKDPIRNLQLVMTHEYRHLMNYAEIQQEIIKRRGKTHRYMGESSFGRLARYQARFF